jgi:hypothetical protein
VQAFTSKLWAKQNQHPGDRLRLFTAVAGAIDACTVFYPGCYVDVAPSFVWPSVVYVDSDRRAARFFADASGVREIIAGHRRDPDQATVAFVPGDYTTDLALPIDTFDLLISLYAGPISAHCTHLLRPDGWLLVNPSHGDVALASLDDRYELDAVVRSRSGDYTVSRRGLDQYLVPKRPGELTVASIRGRGVAYTTPAFAYLFRRVR